MIRGENIEFLHQLANSLKQAELKLEESYRNKDPDSFNKLKKFIFQVQKKIFEGIE